MRIVKEMAEAAPVTIVNSINPYRLQGQKTVAFEIVDGARPRARLPLHPGRQRGQYQCHGPASASTPGCNPPPRPCLVRRRLQVPLPAVMSGGRSWSVTRPRARHRSSRARWWTIPRPRRPSASAARNGDPPMASRIRRLVRRARGCRYPPRPAPARRAGGHLLRAGSAIALGGALRDIARQDAGRQPVTCTLTGHGLKDPDTAICNAPMA